MGRYYLSKKVNLKKGLADSVIFEEMNYEDFRIYHDVTIDQYYVKTKEDPLTRVTLLTEIRFSDDIEISDEELLDGFGKAKEKGFDYCGEFTELMETSNSYLHRYGYFVENKENSPEEITELIIL